MRELTDETGTTWTVYAIVPDAYDDRIGFSAGFEHGWLCFQSAEEKFRYPGIPPEWELLQDSALLNMRTDARRVDSRVLFDWRLKTDPA